jgi:DNA-binding XRE family transcriptional regulator
MPNIASALKAEIARLARKELRSETETLKRIAARQRADIAYLKRQLAALQRDLLRLSRSAGRPQPRDKDEPSEGAGIRFSAKGLAKHRQRLGLSAEAIGKLVGVSALSIYKWEGGTARPRARYLPAIAGLRTLKKSVAAEVLSQR